jgi:putative peptidoglycan lipid II flippase
MQENPQTNIKKKRIPLANVAVLLVATALVGQLLGLLRTMLINGKFGTTGNNSTDVYFAAFTIPDFFFYIVAAGVLGVAFIPVLADRLAKNDRKGMWEITSSVLNLLMIVMSVVGVIVFVFAEPFVKYFYGMSGDRLDDTVFIMRCLALNPLFFTISGILTAAQQTLGRFFFFAVAPLVYNLAIIGSIYMFAHTEMGIRGLGIGAFVGGILQLLVVIVGLIGTHFSWRPKIMWRSSDFKTVLRQLPPRSLDQGVDQVQTVVETGIAGRLGEGVISHYNNAFILQMAPVLLVGSAISTAAFPRLAARLSQGRPDLFRRDFLRILRFMIWISIPIVIVAYLSRGYLARIIFKEGSNEIALMFGLMAVAIFFRILYTIMSRWFYAQKDTKTPLFVSLFTIALNIVLAILLSRRSAYGAPGLAMAVSIAAAVEVVILGIIMVVRDRGLLNMEFWNGVGRAISVSGFSVLAGYLAVSTFPLRADDVGFMTLGSKLAIITGATFLVHVAISGLFGLDEVRPIFVWIKRIVMRPIRGAY